jgi:Phage integrase family
LSCRSRRRERRACWHTDDPVAPWLSPLYQTAAHRARSDLEHLQLRGPHDLRHSFSTWLEDEGIPARVIDELMGHQRSRGGELEGGSRIGARDRHTTPEMAARVIQALDTRLRLALQVAEAITPAELDQNDRVSSEASSTGLGGTTTQLLAGSPTARIEPCWPGSITSRPWTSGKSSGKRPVGAGPRSVWLVGVTGFEPVASAVRSECGHRLPPSSTLRHGASPQLRRSR